jgi:hypothetical protein
MKRILAAAAMIAVLTAPAVSQQISFKLTGGWTTVQGDDYKTAVAGRMSLLRDSFASVSGEFRPLTNGAAFQAEIITHWGKRLAVGFGGGYYQIGKSDLVSASMPGDSGTVLVETALWPQISAIPFFLNAHYKMSLGTKLGLDIFAGPVFQIAQFSSERNATSSIDPLGEVEAFKASVPTLGIQAGLSLSLSLGRGISLVADGLYRYEKAFKFVGNWTYFGTSSTGETTGTSSSYYLWYYDYAGAKGSYPLVGFYDENGPTGTGITGARKAELNLSGVTLTAGIKIDL